MNKEYLKKYLSEGEESYVNCREKIITLGKKIMKNLCSLRSISGELLPLPLIVRYDMKDWESKNNGRIRTYLRINNEGSYFMHNPLTICGSNDLRKFNKYISKEKNRIDYEITIYDERIKRKKGFLKGKEEVIIKDKIDFEINNPLYFSEKKEDFLDFFPGFFKRHPELATSFLETFSEIPSVVLNHIKEQKTRFSKCGGLLDKISEKNPDLKSIEKEINDYKRVQKISEDFSKFKEDFPKFEETYQIKVINQIYDSNFENVKIKEWLSRNFPILINEATQAGGQKQ